MLKQHYKNILFDLDGTLTDSAEGVTRSVQYALNKFGINASLTELKSFIGPPLQHSFQNYYGFKEGEVLQAIKYFREYYSETGLFQNKLYSHVPEMLEKLSVNGAKLYLATSKATYFAEIILRHFQINDYFTTVTGANFDGTRVVKWEVIDYVLKQNNSINKSTTVMIGDHRQDIEGARCCGIDSIAVTYGYGHPEELSKAGPTHFVHSVPELTNLLLTG